MIDISKLTMTCGQTCYPRINTREDSYIFMAVSLWSYTIDLEMSHVRSGCYYCCFYLAISADYFLEIYVYVTNKAPEKFNETRSAIVEHVDEWLTLNLKRIKEENKTKSLKEQAQLVVNAIADFIDYSNF